jgi:hypothetical protein
MRQTGTFDHLFALMTPPVEYHKYNAYWHLTDMHCSYDINRCCHLWFLFTATIHTLLPLSWQVKYLITPIPSIPLSAAAWVLNNNHYSNIDCPNYDINFSVFFISSPRSNPLLPPVNFIQQLLISNCLNNASRGIFDHLFAFSISCSHLWVLYKKLLLENGPDNDI